MMSALKRPINIIERFLILGKVVVQLIWSCQVERNVTSGVDKTDNFFQEVSVT